MGWAELARYPRQGIASGRSQSDAVRQDPSVDPSRRAPSRALRTRDAATTRRRRDRTQKARHPLPRSRAARRAIHARQEDGDDHLAVRELGAELLESEEVGVE